MNQEVELHISNLKNWQAEIQLLRKIVLECGLNETYKWKQPCYTIDNKNVLIISDFKHYCAINFFKGSLLSDNEKKLTKPGKNTQGGRQFRFNDQNEIIANQALLKSYIFEAIQVERNGNKVIPISVSQESIPGELISKFKEDPSYKVAFEKLTPGRQRAYIMYFSNAKQSETRSKRIEKYKKRILLGKGLNDCVCGLSKRNPNCDGSHKQLKTIIDW